MDVGSARIDLAIRLQIAVEVVSGQAAIDELDTADLDDPMAILRIETRGLGVEHDLSHVNTRPE
jgi:hypothetical protein